jgi:hypothetical protein
VIAEPFGRSGGVLREAFESGCVAPFVERHWEEALGNADGARRATILGFRRATPTALEKLDSLFGVAARKIADRIGERSKSLALGIRAALLASLARPAEPEAAA